MHWLNRLWFCINVLVQHFRRRTAAGRIRLLALPVVTALLLLLLLVSHMWSGGAGVAQVDEFQSIIASSIVELGPTASLHDAHPESFDKPLVVGMKNFTQLSFNLAYEAEWRQHAHLVVYGVLATDKPGRRVIRDLQRTTWMQYPDVATRRTSFEGLLLVLYPTAPFAHIAPNVTVAMMKEMQQHRDVLLLRMREEAPTTRKAAGENGRYGLPLHLSNTRKLVFYLLYAHNAFPTTPFFAKGDDDCYVYVPEYLRMVKLLPRINVVYGAVSRPFIRKYVIALGYSYLISRDILRDTVAEHVVNYLFTFPVNRQYTAAYEEIGFAAEDWLVGATMDRLYGRNPAVARPLPPAPPPDPRLPAVDGWGKRYMEYVADPWRIPHVGCRPNSLEEPYDIGYSFPAPSELRPGNVLWVDDICRINNQRWPNASAPRLIVAHRTVTKEQFAAYWGYHERLGEHELMRRPSHINVTNADYQSDVFLKDLELCSPNYYG